MFFLFLGPAKHCTNYTIEEQNRPTSFNQLFQLRNSPLENCGDLLFSGHMVSASCVVYCITYYLFVMISTNKRKFVRFSVIAYVIFMWICLACQIFTAIATRNHYTVDIWLGGLIGYMNWMWHRFVVLPKDPVVGKSDRFHGVKIYWNFYIIISIIFFLFFSFPYLDRSSLDHRTTYLLWYLQTKENVWDLQWLHMWFLCGFA